MNFYKRNKYGAVKTTTYDGITHDSKKEANRWLELNLLQRAGEISDLKRQVKYELIPKVGKFRATYYVADFVYRNKDGFEVVEDTKSEATANNQVFRIKEKLMLWRHGIEIKKT